MTLADIEAMKQYAFHLREAAKYEELLMFKHLTYNDALCEIMNGRAERMESVVEFFTGK